MVRWLLGVSFRVRWLSSLFLFGECEVVGVVVWLIGLLVLFVSRFWILDVI